jgi:hypothetical protein
MKKKKPEVKTKAQRRTERLKIAESDSADGDERRGN